MEYCRWPVWSKNFLWEPAPLWWHPHHKGFIANPWNLRPQNYMAIFLCLIQDNGGEIFPTTKTLKYILPIRFDKPVRSPYQGDIHIMNYFGPNLSTQNPLTPKKITGCPGAPQVFLCTPARASKAPRIWVWHTWPPWWASVPRHISVTWGFRGFGARIEGCLEDHPM